MERKRILFFAEAVTLAHVARPIALAEGLDGARYEIFMASASRSHRFFANKPWQILSINSISSEQFLQALAQGSPVYSEETLRGYIKNDVELIKKINPDIIVGDFRLSLSVSARLVGIPYITITNAYWSPYYQDPEFPLPELPVTRILPLPIAGLLFRLILPLAFRLHCMPLNRVRQANGLVSLGNDLRSIYTDADYVLFADLPALFSSSDLPSNYQYLGPILWSPPVPKPHWWDQLPADKPIVYVTLGSSGKAVLLPTIFEALAGLPVTVIAATAGADIKRALPENVYINGYLPGTEAAKRARLVICNGGSLTSYQALAAGVPVLGIASNADQFLNMRVIEKAGAGYTLRSDRLSITATQALVRNMLFSPNLESTMVLRKVIATYDAPRQFATFIDKIFEQ